MVATEGSPSGTAATASEIAGVRAWLIGSPRSRFVASNSVPAPAERGRAEPVSSRSRLCTPPVGGRSADCSARRASVSGPVATTAARPCPAATAVPS